MKKEKWFKKKKGSNLPLGNRGRYAKRAVAFTGVTKETLTKRLPLVKEASE